MHRKCSISRVTDNMTEFMTKDSGLLPFFQIFVDRDCPATQNLLPEPINIGGQIEEVDNAIQFRCQAERVGRIVPSHQISHAQRGVHRLHLFYGGDYR